MPDGMIIPRISAILHLPKIMPYSLQRFFLMLHAVLQQYEQHVEILILDEQEDQGIYEEISKINTEANIIQYVRGSYQTLGNWLNAAITSAHGEYILYVNNLQTEVYLKNAAAVTFLLTCERHPDCGMVYADYEIESNDSYDPIHLLKHHAGRLRDNQDFGKVLFYKRSILHECNGFDETLHSNTLYDIRLKIAEKATLKHISDKYDGTLYRIFTEEKKHNVFDYLLSAKEIQIEAENVLTKHLKRIGAYLPPDTFYQNRTSIEEKPKLKATVIIPVNNRPQFIEKAIESVLNQTVQEIEVIVVVNGGSSDPTLQAVKKFMLGGERYTSNKPCVHLIEIDINNIGLCLNLGTKFAQSEYYIQLDSDDRLKPNAIEKILKKFDSDPQIGMVIGSYEVWELQEESDEIKRVEDIPVVTHDEWTDQNGRNNLLRINGAGAPRAIPFSIIKEMGYFSMNDEVYSLNYGEDYEMVLKISEKYRVGRIWDPIYNVVRHKGGTDHAIDKQTINRNDEAKDNMRLKTLQRRIKMNQH